jgi:DNA-binding NarL/FixJ family response regulator
VTAPIRVVIADDSPTIRDGLRFGFAAVTEVTVVGEAVNGRELLAVVNRHRPDVVLTDIRMPGLDGITATQLLLAHHPGLGVLILTEYDDDARVEGALAAGARGYLCKDAERDDIVRAIVAVARGGAVYGPSVARRVGGFHSRARRKSLAHAFPELTVREREVLELIARGSRNREIAHRLGVSEKTVRNHMSALKTKLRVADRDAAMAKAIDAGFGQDS